MWLPFSRYISATPLSARLIDSVPPDVKITSLGSRAPMTLAICSRARSTAVSASQPKEWFRLAGWPNFSVEAGIIASTTRGSAGVVDCESMKMGNFSAIWISPSLAGSVSLDRQCFGDVLVAQLGQAHGIEQLADRRLQLLHGSPQVAAKLLRASSVVEAAHDVDRPLERADDLPDGDVARVAHQYVPSLGSVLADDQPALGESLRADSAELVVDGNIVNRHQPIIGALGEAEHRR